MRAEATIPPFPSLGKGRGDGWPSRHQRRSCRSTLMAASPQPSLAPMKAGVASPLPSPSPSLADANSGKVGRAAESKESHFATLGLAPAAAAPLGQLRRLWCQAKVALRSYNQFTENPAGAVRLGAARVLTRIFG
mgnify:CR=1 FL=1